MMVLNSPHELHDNGLIFALFHTPDYTLFIVLFFNSSLMLHVVVTATGPFILQHPCKALWNPLHVDILYHPVVCPDNSFPASAMLLTSSSRNLFTHTVKVKQSPSNNTVAGSIHNSVCYQADTRKETIVLVSPESLFSDHLLMVTCYGCYTGKTSHKLVCSMWNSCSFWL